ncbi:hypothetical protein Acor_67380 [Acrocarpospora corrugata]|uniref:Uncharacterized protein n=1 Tax=Acrocarpospora corrugata TaxID=35763 RepID=A0A5M3W8W4_9ACTN|nr:hypothetical protein Acor_67380 [Acrocarpospora corrugata]
MVTSVQWLEVPIQPPTEANTSPATKYEVGRAVVVYRNESAYVGLTDGPMITELLAHPDVRSLSAGDLRKSPPIPGLPMTWEGLANQIPTLGVSHPYRRAVGLGDVIAAITRRARIPECGSCSQRRNWLNQIPVWGWWRSRPPQT